METKREIYNPNNYLFDMNEVIDKAVERIRTAYKFASNMGLGKLYVCFSGGKDSIAVYGLCKLAFGARLLDCCDFEYNHTGIDFPEVVYFIREKMPFVHCNYPKETIWQMMIRETFPPTRLVRYCCRTLKEYGGIGRFCLTGVRWEESTNRKLHRGELEKDGIILNADNDEDRRELEHCIPKNKFVCNPIIDWKETEVWRFIVAENLPYPEVYDEGFARVGCIGCPMVNRKERERHFKRYPKYREQWIRTFAKIIKRRDELGRKKYFDNPEEMFEWWMNL